MSRAVRVACVLLTLMVLASGCGGKSKSTAYPVPPPAPPGEDTPSAEVSQNLAMALGPTSRKIETLEERRDNLPSELVGDRGNAVYSGERLRGAVAASASNSGASSSGASGSTVPPAPVVAKVPPAVPRVPVERQAASAAPPAPAPANVPPPAPPAAVAAKAEPSPPEPPAPAAPPAPTVNLAGDGQVTAQLGAFRTRANAEGGWQRLRAAHPDQLGDRALILQEADLGDRGIYYRVRTGPFADIATAKAFCEQLRARDQACVVLSRH